MKKLVSCYILFNQLGFERSGRKSRKNELVVLVIAVGSFILQLSNLPQYIVLLAGINLSAYALNLPKNIPNTG